MSGVTARQHRVELARFVLAGAVNTALSLGVYWALLLVSPYAVAYSAAFIAGMLSAFALNTYFVFRTPWSWRRFAAFPAVQAVNYLIGLGFLAILVDVLGMADEHAPLISIPLTIPINFVMSRWLLRRGHPPATAG